MRDGTDLSGYPFRQSRVRNDESLAAAFATVLYSAPLALDKPNHSILYGAAHFLPQTLIVYAVV